jgi:hypothetical protein
MFADFAEETGARPIGVAAPEAAGDEIVPN